MISEVGWRLRATFKGQPKCTEMLSCTGTKYPHPLWVWHPCFRVKAKAKQNCIHFIQMDGPVLASDTQHITWLLDENVNAVCSDRQIIRRADYRGRYSTFGHISYRLVSDQLNMAFFFGHVHFSVFWVKIAPVTPVKTHFKNSWKKTKQKSFQSRSRIFGGKFLSLKPSPRTVELTHTQNPCSLIVFTAKNEIWLNTKFLLLTTVKFSFVSNAVMHRNLKKKKKKAIPLFFLSGTD